MKLEGKKYYFRTLKQKKVVFMKKYNFKAVFEKKQALTYTEPVQGDASPRRPWLG